MRTLMSGISFGESPRWHEGRLWFCDWAAEEVIAVDLAGNHEVITHVRSFPFSIDWLPDGRLVVISARDVALLTMEEDGSVIKHVDLSELPTAPGNEIVVDGRGNVYVNGAGFDLMGGEAPKPGAIALVRPDGTATEVAGGIEFPNGMAITPDDRTLIIAESYGRRLTAFEIGDDGNLSNTRVWADLGDGVPDGITIDADGAVWYADVPNKRCVRVREGGEVLQTVEADRGCFACMLGGEDGRTLFIVVREWGGAAAGASAKERTGQILVTEAPAPKAGWP